ncbi:hypothetical protein BKA70DRAFT_735413 [Coprinopsis sp. MPI-PUGE-AT-0042]|nr:hypothetical protein BKA70DRAFT_735413 [Coprinopsis sp. MPI-PUGE-AT-0042]
MKGLFKKKKLPQKGDLEKNMCRPESKVQEDPAPADDPPCNNKTPDAAKGANSGDSGFQNNAKIWTLYLREATDHAKTQTELWKTGLESLLLFAGLFAGVVSAFLIESRKKLQMEEQELLIRNIRNFQQGLPLKEDDYRPTVDHLWINGLWFGSLLITLFSTIVGVLAKSWLVEYAPLAMSEDSHDAYRRWKADKSVERWHMKRVVTMIPLFVQLAFFLFSAGLAIQCFNDHRGLGYAVSAIVGFGVVMYIAVTVLPLLLSDGSCPFRTPLSEILLHLWKLLLLFYVKSSGAARPAVLTDSPDEKELQDVLATIWTEQLINSPKQDYVDEAFAELARIPLAAPLLKVFADFGAPGVSLRRLDSWMTSSYHADPRRNEIMSNHLLALSHFVDYSESNEHAGLKSTLKGSLQKGSPFGQWTFFAEQIRPLAHSIRIPILLAFGEDISAIEVAEQPWDQLARNLQLKDRIRFILASCRALARGKCNLKKTSALSITSCMALAIQSGSKSEWSGVAKPHKKEVLDFARSCIIRVCNEIVTSWKGNALEYWKAYSSPANIAESGQELTQTGYPPSLRASFLSPKGKHRHQAIRVLLSMEDLQNDFGNQLLSNLIRMAVLDKDEGVREAAISAVLKLGANGFVACFLSFHSFTHFKGLRNTPRHTHPRVIAAF